MIKKQASLVGSLALLLMAFIVLFFSLRAPNPGYFSGGEPRTEQQSLQKLLQNEWIPGHPLYPLVMLRDRIAIWTTADSLQRAMLFAKLSEQRFFSASLLLERKETGLALSTLSKSQAYLVRAGDAVSNLERSSEVAGFRRDFFKQVISFEERVRTLKDTVDDTQKMRLDALLRDVMVLRSQLSEE